ncbi:MAG: Sec-independent protein translocase protein TatB [Gammaproteobacteria bacterium]|nr:Sec-independent protein translocase protein TatB [Gammaproteobacteria bacterium]MDH4255804.1 Sec-independent protein translocase protein TatB [Gammaproteobacteria bacterium]MDH5311449.1 Sec-independent protein translocase protein TatB [Gammaproteobacteria bacterium]
MSGVGFWELIILFLIGLIVLGPERLPRVANQLGSWLGQARRMTRVMKRQLEDELNVEKGLNLNSIVNPAPKAPSVTQPQYVHDQNRKAESLPDDYSPAHGPEEAGVGVGDDRDYIDDDELEPTSGQKKETAAAPEPTDEKPKQESA